MPRRDWECPNRSCKNVNFKKRDRSAGTSRLLAFLACALQLRVKVAARLGMAFCRAFREPDRFLIGFA